MSANGYFTPAQATKIARKLHEEGKLDVWVNMRRAQPGTRYQGDDERRAGRTATVDVRLAHGLAIDELVDARDKVRGLGYDGEVEGGDLTILGPWVTEAKGGAR